MHRTTEELQARVGDILEAPENAGPIEMIVRRPGEGEREVIETGELSTGGGLAGDDWINRLDENGQPPGHAQLTLMSSRVADAVAVTRDRWPLAGDQVYVDLDISMENLPAGSRLLIGNAVVEISQMRHSGCDKFAGRFGKEALRFVNVGIGREHRFRGVNTFVVESGSFQVGDKITKV